MLRKES